MVTRRDFLKVTAAGSALLTVGDFTEAKNRMHPFVQSPDCLLYTSDAADE